MKFAIIGKNLDFLRNGPNSLNFKFKISPFKDDAVRLSSIYVGNQSGRHYLMNLTIEKKIKCLTQYHLVAGDGIYGIDAECNREIVNLFEELGYKKNKHRFSYVYYRIFLDHYDLENELTIFEEKFDEIYECWINK